MAYLKTNPNPNGQHFYETRVRPILAVVEHITAGLEDLDATDDHSAENTARYAGTTDRRVSWHQGTDADSTIVLLPDDHTAFHVRGYNSCTLGREISKRHTDWRSMPKKWLDGTLSNAARADAEWCRLHGIPVRKATKEQLDAAILLWEKTGKAQPVGFVSHWELDPTRRTDPGKVSRVGDTFPWHEHLELVRLYLNRTVTPAPEDKDMIAPTIQACYAQARGEGYNVIIEEPNGFRHWHEGALNAADWKAHLNQWMLPALRKESGKQIHDVQ